MSVEPTCVLNRCGRPQGQGTWCCVVGLHAAQPVCEEHWLALRDIFPVEPVERSIADGEAEIAAAAELRPLDG